MKNTLIIFTISLIISFYNVSFASDQEQKQDLINQNELWISNSSEIEILNFIKQSRSEIESNEQWIIRFDDISKTSRALRELKFFKNHKEEAVDELIEWMAIWEPRTSVGGAFEVGPASYELFNMIRMGWDISDKLMHLYNTTDLRPIKRLVAEVFYRSHINISREKAPDWIEEMYKETSGIPVGPPEDAFGNFWGHGNYDKMVITAEEYRKQKDSYKSASTSNKASQEDMQNQIYEHQNTFLTTQEDNRSFIKIIWKPLVLGFIAIAVFILYRLSRRSEI